MVVRRFSTPANDVMDRQLSPRALLPVANRTACVRLPVCSHQLLLGGRSHIQKGSSAVGFGLHFTQPLLDSQLPSLSLRFGNRVPSLRF